MSKTIMSKTIMSKTIKRDDFPRFGTPEEQLRFLLQYAILAPSSHNTQPWLWEISGNEVALRADRTRMMAALDPLGRELIMSCGAALQHLCLASRASGLATLVQTLPDLADSDLLARVRMVASQPPTEDEEQLFSFITKRHTHRGQYEERGIPFDVLQALREDANLEGASLHFVHNPEPRQAIVELIERGDLTQNRDASIRRDIAAWIAPPGARPDGIPTEALGISGLVSHIAPLAYRVMDRGESLATRDANLAHNAPALAVLATSEDGPQSWLNAGQALGRVLLRARSKGIWASFFSQPIQVDEAWLNLRHIMGVRNYPQLIFRLGYAQPVPATPRRPVEEVATVLTTVSELD